MNLDALTNIALVHYRMGYLEQANMDECMRGAVKGILSYLLITCPMMPADAEGRYAVGWRDCTDAWLNHLQAGKK